jgi:hypothetical protein
MIARPCLQRSCRRMSLVDLTISDRRINVLAGYSNWGMGDSPVLVRSDRSFPCATPEGRNSLHSGP